MLSDHKVPFVSDDARMASLTNDQMTKPNDGPTMGSNGNDSDSEDSQEQPTSLKQLLAKCKKIYNKLKWYKDVMDESYDAVLREIVEVWDVLELDQRFEFENDYVQFGTIRNSMKTR